jgi:hypothetical protein
MRVKIDQEFKQLIPPLTSEEYNQLEKNILAEGCREALIVWGATLIDGHNRFEICTKHGIDFEIVSRDFRERAEVIEWMILNQFGRRSLSNYNRALLALKLEDSYKQRGLLNKSKGGKRAQNEDLTGLSKDEIFNSREEMAKTADVSQGVIQMVKHIEENATDEVKQRAASGDLTVNAAYNLTKKEEKRASITSIKDHFKNHTLDRRIAIYPNPMHFYMHIANSFDQQTGKGKVADIILRNYYDALPEAKKNHLLALFDTMTLDQIERTNDARG